jgi:hypothetical protein
METLVDLFELHSRTFEDSGTHVRRPRATIVDLEVEWQDEERFTPGVPSESWHRARGWSSDD